MHLQGSPHYLGAINLNEFSNHTLTLKKDKNQPPKSIYICDGDIFKKLDSELSRAQEQTLDTSYVILPTNTSTLRAKPPKDESKYSINIDQMPQTRLIHLSMATDPGFVVKSPPREPVTMTCSEVQGSPMVQQQQQLAPQNISNESQIPNSLCDTGDSGNSGVVSKSETVSTLSMSSLEVSMWINYCLVLRPEWCAALDASHTRCFKRSTLGQTQPTMQCQCYNMKEHWHVILFCNLMFKIPHDFHRLILLLNGLSLTLQPMQIPTKMLACITFFPSILCLGFRFWRL